MFSLFRTSRKKPVVRLSPPRQLVQFPDAPFGTDWLWQPDISHQAISPSEFAHCPKRQNIGDSAVLFHDCEAQEITARQMRDDADDRTDFGLQFEIGTFDGSFLSLACDLPDAAQQDLKKRHVFRFEADLDCPQGILIYARLNAKHGPNVEKILQHMGAGSDHISAEFDLAYTQLNIGRLEKIWLDLIFEDPAGKIFTLRNIKLSRRPRAEL